MQVMHDFAMTRHVRGLLHGVPGARAFRRHLATEAVKPGAGIAVLQDALSLVADAPAARPVRTAAA
jgi:tRNA-dihydrouridine synthase A